MVPKFDIEQRESAAVKHGHSEGVNQIIRSSHRAVLIKEDSKVDRIFDRDMVRSTGRT